MVVILYLRNKWQKSNTVRANGAARAVIGITAPEEAHHAEGCLHIISVNEHPAPIKRLVRLLRTDAAVTPITQ